LGSLAEKVTMNRLVDTAIEMNILPSTTPSRFNNDVIAKLKANRDLDEIAKLKAQEENKSHFSDVQNKLKTLRGLIGAKSPAPTQNSEASAQLDTSRNQESSSWEEIDEECRRERLRGKLRN